VALRDLSPGTVIQRTWCIDARLGGGGMGSVFACTQLQTRERVALKILHRHIAEDERLRARFITEGRAQNRVQHRGVVRALAEGEHEGVPFLVMELAHGQSLKLLAESQGGRLSLAQLAPVITQLLDVLAAVHDANIVHRDIKPDNLVVAADGSLKLVDFGIARIEEESGNTTTGSTLGTPAFMAPEQVLGRQGRVDRRADLYAVGAVIHRLLSGFNLHHPASGAELLIAMGTQQAPSIASTVPGLTPAIVRVVDRALSFDREARFSDASSMRAAWLAALNAPAEGRALTAIVEQTGPLVVSKTVAMQAVETKPKLAATLPQSAQTPVAAPSRPPPAVGRPTSVHPPAERPPVVHPAATQPLQPLLAPQAPAAKAWRWPWPQQWSAPMLIIGMLAAPALGAGAYHLWQMRRVSLATKQVPIREQKLSRVKALMREEAKGLRVGMVALTTFGASGVGQDAQGQGVNFACNYSLEECSRTDGGESPIPRDQAFSIEQVPWDNLPEYMADAERRFAKEKGFSGTAESAAYQRLFGVLSWSVVVKGKGEFASYCYDTEADTFGCAPQLDVPPAPPPQAPPAAEPAAPPLVQPRNPPKAPRAKGKDIDYGTF
jgi:serine/threonine protein kinase